MGADAPGPPLAADRGQPDGLGIERKITRLARCIPFHRPARIAGTTPTPSVSARKLKKSPIVRRAIPTLAASRCLSFRVGGVPGVGVVRSRSWLRGSCGSCTYGVG